MYKYCSKFAENRFVNFKIADGVYGWSLNLVHVGMGCWVPNSCHTTRVRNWVGSGPQDPNLGWLDQKIVPISNSSLNLRKTLKLNPMFGVVEAPRVHNWVQ